METRMQIHEMPLDQGDKIWEAADQVHAYYQTGGKAQYYARSPIDGKYVLFFPSMTAVLDDLDTTKNVDEWASMIDEAKTGFVMVKAAIW